MSRHDGVSCDSCLRNNFKGRRYKCLICFDYDLCGSCFETGASSARHLPSHAMQCMIPRADYELYYSGESSSIASEAPLSLTCPYCAKLGLTENTLYEHVCSEHSDLSLEVVCPICASQPGGEPNNLVSDFVTHVQRDHSSAQEYNSDGRVSSSHLQTHERPVREQVVNPRRPTQRGGHTTTNGINRNASRRAPFGSVPMSPREPTMENITEILSQLSAAGRRNHSVSTMSSAQHTLQQMQLMQMQLDRQNTQSRFERASKRGTTYVSSSAGNVQVESLIPSSSTTVPAGNATNGVLAAGTNQSGSEITKSQYLLSKYMNDEKIFSSPKKNSEQKNSQNAEVTEYGVDRAQFVENLLLTSLLPNRSLWNIRSSQTSSSSVAAALSTPPTSTTPSSSSATPSPPPPPPSREAAFHSRGRQSDMLSTSTALTESFHSSSNKQTEQPADDGSAAVGAGDINTKDHRNPR